MAFHLLGSLNFGMAEDTSDVDAVLYFRDQALQAPDDASCPVPDYVQEKIETCKAAGLVVSICDCLNLAQIEAAIQREDVESLVLQRFIFYATTCRCVNGRVIREVEHLFANNEWLRSKVEQELAQYFRMLISSFRHAYSFRKYQQRLREKGMTVPPYIEELIWQYLQRTEKKGRGKRMTSSNSNYLGMKVGTLIKISVGSFDSTYCGKVPQFCIIKYVTCAGPVYNAFYKSPLYLLCTPVTLHEGFI